MDEYDEDIAYGIWFIEKEFNIGPIHDTFPALKFWNILDDQNIEKYKKMTEKDMPGKSVKTFGG